MPVLLLVRAYCTVQDVPTHSHAWLETLSTGAQGNQTCHGEKKELVAVENVNDEEFYPSLEYGIDEIQRVLFTCISRLGEKWHPRSVDIQRVSSSALSQHSNVERVAKGLQSIEVQVEEGISLRVYAENANLISVQEILDCKGRRNSAEAPWKVAAINGSVELAANASKRRAQAEGQHSLSPEDEW